MSKGLLYHYFPTKRAFYMACLRHAIEDLRRVTEPRPGLSPQDQLREGLTGYLEYVEDHAAAYQAVLRGAIGSDPEVAAIADGFRATMYERIVAPIPEAELARELRLAVKGWIGFVEAVSLEWVAHRRPRRAVLVDLLTSELAHLLQTWGTARKA